MPNLEVHGKDPVYFIESDVASFLFWLDGSKSMEIDKYGLSRI